MNKKILISLCILLSVTPALGSEVRLNLQQPKSSKSSVQVEFNRNKANSALIKLITLDGISSTESITEIANGDKSFGRYFLSADDKFAQSNITAAYSDYAKAILASSENDFQSLLLAYKLANIGFYTLSQQAINQIKDKNLYSSQTNAVKQIFFPSIALSYDDEILLAEMYADIYYNNLANEAAKELIKKPNLLRRSDYANYVLAQAYFETAEYNKAMNYINKALNQKKESPVYLQYKARILCEMKDYNETLKILNKLASTPYLNEKFIEGVNIQKEFTLSKMYKDTAQSKYHLAKYFYMIGENTRAMKEINNSIIAAKKNYEAYTLLGHIQANSGEFSKAIETYNKALKYNKKYVPALIGLGNVEKKTGMYETALQKYYTAQKYAKNDVDLAVMIAQLLNLTSETVRAKEICANLVTKAPNSSNLYYIMADIYPEKKEEYLRKALSLNGFNTEAWLDLAEIDLMKGQIELAEKALTAVRVSDKENYKYYYIEGLLNKRNGDFQKAGVSFKKSLKLNPNFTPAQKELNTLNL